MAAMADTIVRVAIYVNVDDILVLTANVAGVSYLVPQKAKGEDQEAILLPRNFGLQAAAA